MLSSWDYKNDDTVPSKKYNSKAMWRKILKTNAWNLQPSKHYEMTCKSYFSEEITAILA